MHFGEARISNTSLISSHANSTAEGISELGHRVSYILAPLSCPGMKIIAVCGASDSSASVTPGAFLMIFFPALRWRHGT